MSTTAPRTIPRLDEGTVMLGFHTFLTNALAQAKAERLLDDETLASAQADLMVAGPALCLYFAALRSSTTPPSVPIPRAGLPRDTPPLVLSCDTVPQNFAGFFLVWTENVPLIQALPSAQQHDLARIICGHEPLAPNSGPSGTSLQRISADLRAVAIEISQRRTFQERYAFDLQAALDYGSVSRTPGSPGAYKATFVPPPSYEDTPKSALFSASPPLSRDTKLPLSPPATPGRQAPMQLHSPPPSPLMHSPQAINFTVTPQDRPPANSRPSVPSVPVPALPPRSRPTTPSDMNKPLPPSPGVRPASATHSRNTSSSSTFLELPAGFSGSAGAGPSSRRSPHRSTLSIEQNPSIIAIRETLYAALGDVLAQHPSIRGQLKSDPARAYFASMGLAILEAASHAIKEDGSVVGVLGRKISPSDVPEDYRPLMRELGAIGRRAHEFAEEDEAKVLQLLASDSNAELQPPRMDRVTTMLEKGIARGWEEAQQEGAFAASVDEDALGILNRAGSNTQNSRRARGRSLSPHGTALQLTNKINSLALNMIKLEAFQERQGDVFKVLAGVK